MNPSVDKKYQDKPYLTDGDEKRIGEGLYFLDAELLSKISQEENRINQLLDKKSTSEGQDTDNQKTTLLDEMEIDDINKLQEDVARLRTVQKKMRDERLDDFKELIFPAIGFLHALALFGLSALSVVVGPVVALLFAGAFFVSNLYTKGINSRLNIFFGIATLMQASAVVIGIILLLGIAIVNPVIAPVLMVSGGVLLFLTAMVRGGERQKKAQTICLPSIRKRISEVNDLSQKIVNKIKGMNPKTVNEKNNKSNIWVQEEKEKKQGIEIKDYVLHGDIKKINQEIRNQESLMKDIKALKATYDVLCYDLDDFENLLRTVKNPIEKRARIQEITDIQKGVEGDLLSDLPEIKDEMNEKIKKVSADVDHVWRKDIPWLVVNIGIKVVAVLSSAVAIGILADAAAKLGIGMALSPLVLSPIGMAVILASALCVGAVFLCASLQKNNKHREKKKDKVQDTEVLKEHDDSVKAAEVCRDKGNSMILTKTGSGLKETKDRASSLGRQREKKE